jgi:hypothetical protein
MVPRFFTDEPSHHPTTFPAMSHERWEGSSVKKRDIVGRALDSPDLKRAYVHRIRSH